MKNSTVRLPSQSMNSTRAISKLLRSCSLLSLIVVASCLSTQAQTPLLRYSFDEASSGAANALDSGTSPLVDGIFTGSATRTANTPKAFSPGALDLTDFSNLPFLASGDTDKLDNLTNFTLTVWLNLQNSPAAATGGSANRRLLAKQNAGSFEGFSWNLNNTGLGAAYAADNFKMALFVGGVNGFLFAPSDAATGADHHWQFLAVTYDGTLAADNVKYYVGDETNSVTQLGSTVSIGSGATVDSAAAFKVGNTDAAPSSNTAPPGWLDDARVYGATLDLAQLDAVRLANLANQGNPAQPVQILNPVRSGNGITFSFVTQNSHTHVVEFKNSLNDTNWQTLLTIPGTGATTNITDTATTTRFFRVGTQ